MTTQKAIEAITDFREVAYGHAVLAEALDMAIEALQQGCEKVAESCGDLISRQDAIDALADYIHNVDRVYSTGLLSTTDCMDAARSVLDDLPSANPDLSGYSDRLWKSAYDRGYERCRQDAIDAVDVKCLHRGIVKGIQEIIEDLPSAEVELYCAPQPDLSDDGTLMMTVPHGMLDDVKRVLVDEVGTKFCKTMYQDEPEQECEKCIFKPFKQFPERKKGHWIKISPANIYECSECGKNVMTDDISAYDFCHGCGSYNGGNDDGDE